MLVRFSDRNGLPVFGASRSFPVATLRRELDRLFGDLERAPSFAAANTPTVPLMVGPDGKTVPAPWVAFTRAGCNVGGVATANAVLENTGTGATGDITKVFGNPSPQFTEATASNAAASGTACFSWS